MFHPDTLMSLLSHRPSILRDPVSCIRFKVRLARSMTAHLDLEALDLVLEGADLAHQVLLKVSNCESPRLYEELTEASLVVMLAAMTGLATPQARPRAILEGT